MYRINAKSKLSQNFIMDPRLLDRLAKAGGPLDGKVVVEVGPGPGGITRSILGQGARQCTVIEKDPRFLPALERLNEASGGRLDIHIGDVMNFNMEKLFPTVIPTPWDGPTPNMSIIGNLPFNVSTPLMIKWLSAMSNRQSLWMYGRVPLTLCFQYEVAQRMSAKPGDHCRSRLSVMCQNYTRVQQNFIIPGAAFLPIPEVNVGVVTLIPLTKPYIDHPYKTIEKVVTTMLQSKRKSLQNQVSKLFPKTISSHLANRVLTETRLNPQGRGIDLDMSDWGRVVDSYVRITQENPSLAKYMPRGSKIDLGTPVYDDGEIFIDGDDSDDIMDNLHISPGSQIRSS